MVFSTVSHLARVSPEHKMRIVKAWKAKGQIVAMTGDGVNDAPALKLSDIGVSMGIAGTEVAKEASDMVLTDDNFASIVKAVREGREIYDNIKKYLTYLMRCNIMEILVMFIAVISVPHLAKIYSPDAPIAAVGAATIALTAAQLLWVNLTTDGLPAIALGIDPGDPDIMERKPRDPNESVFTYDVKLYLSLVPIIMTALLLFRYFFYRPWEGQTQLLEARTQLLTSMIVMELANAISARSLNYPVWKVGIFKEQVPVVRRAVIVLPSACDTLRARSQFSVQCDRTWSPRLGFCNTVHNDNFQFIRDWQIRRQQETEEAGYLERLI